MVAAIRLLRPVRAHAARRWVAADLVATPWAPAALAVLVGAAIVVSRLFLVDHGDVSRFIGLGVVFTHRAGLPPGLFVDHGAGWDGQYYYRLALDPLDLHHTAFGITLDTPYRLQRIGYPLLAWLAAAGRGWLVPWALIGVNLVALGVLAGLGAVLARDAGRRPMWGLLLAGYWGFPLSMSWDLSGVVLTAMLVAALLALRRDRPLVAALALTASVLTKETMLVVVGALALSELVGFVRADGGLNSVRRQVAWALPSVAFIAWQVVIRRADGGGGIDADAGRNLAWPLVAVSREVGRDITHITNVISVIDLAQIALLLALATLTITTISRSTAPLCERLALVVMTILALCLSSAVWSGQKDLRSLAELFTLAMVVLISSNRRLLVPATLVGYAWVLAALMQATRP